RRVLFRSRWPTTAPNRAAASTGAWRSASCRCGRNRPTVDIRQGRFGGPVFFCASSGGMHLRCGSGRMQGDAAVPGTVAVQTGVVAMGLIRTLVVLLGLSLLLACTRDAPVVPAPSVGAGADQAPSAADAAADGAGPTSAPGMVYRDSFP